MLAKDVDPIGSSSSWLSPFVRVERDPREVVLLELRGEGPRPGQVAGVVDEDARPVEGRPVGLRARSPRARLRRAAASAVASLISGP